MNNHINRVLTALLAVCNPREVILFGSHAKDTAHPLSDVDLLVVLDTPNPSAARARLHRAVPHWPIEVDLEVVTPQRLADAAHGPRSLVRSALETGRVLYTAPGVLPREVATRAATGDRGGPTDPAEEQ
jgi:uncharacterized protein